MCHRNEGTDAQGCYPIGVVWWLEKNLRVISAFYCMELEDVDENVVRERVDWKLLCLETNANIGEYFP